jgi:hypothetical protein
MRSVQGPPDQGRTDGSLTRVRVLDYASEALR